MSNVEILLDNEAQGDPLEDLNAEHIPMTTSHNNIAIEIEPGKNMNINANLNDIQRERLIKIIQKYKQDFSCDIQI